MKINLDRFSSNAVKMRSRRTDCISRLLCIFHFSPFSAVFSHPRSFFLRLSCLTDSSRVLMCWGSFLIITINILYKMIFTLRNSNNPVSVDCFIFWQTVKIILKIRRKIFHKVNVTCNIFPKTIFVDKLLPSATDRFNRNHVILLLVYCTSQYHSKNILFELQIFCGS